MLSNNYFAIIFNELLGEDLSMGKLDELWQEFDPDMSGEIDMNEFASSDLANPGAQVRKAGAAGKGIPNPSLSGRLLIFLTLP